MERTRNVDFLLLNEHFQHLTLKCDLDLGGSNPIIALCILSYYVDHLCQVISKDFQGLKSYGADNKVLWTNGLTDGVHSYNLPFRYTKGDY
jgi:hypothetical protein